MEKIYCIKDTAGRFDGHLNICSNSTVKGSPNYKWDYYSSEYPMAGDLNKENAEYKIQRLRELKVLAEYDLDWEVVEFSEQEWLDLIKEYHQKNEELGRDHMLNWYYNSSIEMREIKKGCIGSHRKMVNEIYKKHKKGTLSKKLVA